MKNIFLFSLFATAFLTSCSNDSEEDLIDNDPIEETITYNGHVKVIIDNNCIGCHGNPPTNGASTSLLTFNDVKVGVENNNLINRVSAQAGAAGAMPLGGPRLPQNLIDLIVAWEADGLLEN